MFFFCIVSIVNSLDDPVMWGAFKGLLSLDPELARWVLAAEDICFKNPIFSYIFRTGMSLFFVASSLLKDCYQIFVPVLDGFGLMSKC